MMGALYIRVCDGIEMRFRGGRCGGAHAAFHPAERKAYKRPKSHQSSLGRITHEEAFALKRHFRSCVQALGLDGTCVLGYAPGQ